MVSTIVWWVFRVVQAVMYIGMLLFFRACVPMFGCVDGGFEYIRSRHRIQSEIAPLGSISQV